ncbi:MAG: sulfurtransferase TusA family protein [Asgard group archaeon]|nr:sulfurtransferase TusA family protein [Asgard group archaeon]
MPDKEVKFDLYINTKGLPCPIPSMRVRLNIRKVPMGGILKVSSDTPHSQNSIPRFCRNFGHKIISRKELDDGTVIYYIQRKGSKL